MAVISFYGDANDLEGVARWIASQADLAVLMPVDGGFVAKRACVIPIPVRRVCLWCVEAEAFEAIVDGRFQVVGDPWLPFRADDIYFGPSVFQLRLATEMPDGRLGLSSVQRTGGNSPATARVWRRIRRRITTAAERVDKADGEWRYALTGAASEIAGGREFSRSPP